MHVLRLLLLLLHQGKEDIQRKRLRRRKQEQSIHFIFFFQIDQHHSEPFECKIRCMAAACGAIFIHDCESTNIALYCAFFYRQICMLLFCTVLHLNVKSETSLCVIVSNWLLCYLSWLLFSVQQLCYAINRDPQKSKVIKVSGFCNEEWCLCC